MIAVDTSQVAPTPVAESVKSTGAQLVAAFPPRPVVAAWPATEARRSGVATGCWRRRSRRTTRSANATGDWECWRCWAGCVSGPATVGSRRDRARRGCRSERNGITDHARTLFINPNRMRSCHQQPRLYDVAEPNIGLSCWTRHWLIGSGYGGDVRGSVMQDRIRDILAAHGSMKVDPREVGDQADLYELGLTSLASVNVMLALEDAFGVEFPEEVVKKSTFASVRNIEQVVEGLVKSSA